MAKLRDIRFLASETAKSVSASPQDWMGYLDTAAKLYRYPFSDTLLIHAQRPDATACASLEVWNEKMLRWVNRGAKGIALLNETGPRLALRYVFDVSDTHAVRGARPLYLWKLQEGQGGQEGQEGALFDHLTDTYGLDDGVSDLHTALWKVASDMAEDSLEEAMDGLEQQIEGTYLEELDAYSIQVEFRELLANSTYYMLARRCGLDPLDRLDEAAFSGITDFNDLSVLTFLGNATSQIAEPVLKDIGRTVRRISIEEQKKSFEETIEKRNEVVYNEFNTLKRESKNIEGGTSNGNDLPPQGRLPVSEPDRTDGEPGDREIRNAAQDISEGEQKESVSEPVADREAEPAPAGDRDSSAGEDGRLGEEAVGEVPGTGQGGRPDGMGSAHEQPDSDGGGEHLGGIGLHLTEETSEQDLSEAEVEIASALSLPELPTANAQIRKIEEHVAALYAGKISIPSDVVDEVLRQGGNRKGSQLRIIYNFMIEQSSKEYADFVRREYGIGGKGLEIGGKEYSVWFDELGMQIAVGRTVTDQILDKVFLSWADISWRIQQLLRQGEYAPQVVLDAARENALKEHASTLIFMKMDMGEGVAELVFADVEPFRLGFPDAEERVSEMLAQPEYLEDLIERMEGLVDAYGEDRSIMRFKYYRPDKVLEQLRKLAKKAVPYQAREGFVWEEHPVFITQDEIDAFLAKGGPYPDGLLATYAFFIQDKSDKEKADFLKQLYGTGGHSGALSRGDDSFANYSGKGLQLARGDYGTPDAEVVLKWPKVAKRVDYLINNDRFLKSNDYFRMPGYERERIADRIISFYSRMPKEIERPYQEDFFNENARKTLPGLLQEPYYAEELVAKMDAALASLPLDYEDYEKRAETLSVVHQYIEGTYTIFPVKKKEAQTETVERQLSIFDFMGAEEPPAREKAGKTVTIYPGEKNNLPYDIVIEKIHLEEPEKDKQEEKPDTSVQTAGTFEYGGYHFIPYGVLPPDLDFKAATAGTVSERILRFSKYGWAKHPWSREKFYEASGNSKADVFRCLETGQDLLPGDNELFEYAGRFVPLEPEAARLFPGQNPDQEQPEKQEETAEVDSVDDTAPATSSGIDGLDGWESAEGMETPFDEVPEQGMEIVSRFQSTSAMQDGYVEDIVILRYPGGAYYNHYGYDERIGMGAASAGPFETIEDARQAVLAHRPDAKEAVEDREVAEPLQKDSGGDIPIGAVIEIGGREFRIDSVDYANEKATLQDMTMAKEARYPVFRVENLDAVRFWLEQSREHAEERQENAEQQIEQAVSEAMARADAYFEDFSPEQIDVIYEAAGQGLDVTPMLVPDFPPEQMQLIADVLRQIAADEQMVFGQEIAALTGHVMGADEINAVRRERRLPLEQTDRADGGTPEQQIERQHEPGQQRPSETDDRRINFRITDDDLGVGGPKQKFRRNMDAIYLLKKLSIEGRLATEEEQEVLSRYVGWGGIPQAFDEDNREWHGEYGEVKAALSAEEYRAARASTLNAFYTSPTVIKAMYEALGNMGLASGNVLEPSCGVGNFMGLVPEGMEGIKMYGVELDSISGQIAKQLYQKNPIAVQGFETTDYPENFFDCVIGNVPFGQYKVNDRKYDRYNFLIHDYFIAKSIDLVRPGGVVAVVTSNGTMDKQNPAVRKYIAERAELLGAVRLPNNAFMRNANTGVVADILFFQKRDRTVLEQPKWVELGTTPEGYSINSYFAEHPEMVLGEITTESTQYGKQETTVKPFTDADLALQLKEAMQHIRGTITEQDIEDMELDEEEMSIPADPNVKNFSFTNIEGAVYYRENSRMNRLELPAATAERVLGMVDMRDTVQELIKCQMEDGSDADVAALQLRLNSQYDRFTARHGLVSSTANRRAFSQDSSYCLLCSLEILDEEGKLQRKADIFTKRTIRKPEPVTSVDTASEALAVSIGERAKVDVPFMAQLAGKGEDEITEELHGVIFKNPVTGAWETSDEYLSGNVREKLQIAREFAEKHPEYEVNVQGLERVQPKDLDASEIEVRLGATWIDPEYITQFMGETFKTPDYLLGSKINVQYAKVSGQWNVSGKSMDGYGNPLVTSTYGTGRANAYRLLEDALNLRDTKIYDTVQDVDGEKRVLNKKETMLAQQKQETIKEAFKEWIFSDMERREKLCRTYNELFNSTRPREYDGSHIRFVGMTPEITLMQHQKNAVAHILYGHNTLLAHCVGAGKTFQMIAAGMESKRLGLSHKNLYVVPNHLTEQWGSDFLRLYPGANVLVATKKDFEPANRKKFCSRIATGDYDAIIIGHSQFERIPLSRERQIANIERQIDDIVMAIDEAKQEEGAHYTVKQMEKTKKTLETKLERLNDQSRKDDVVTFEQLGVDRLFVDESHFYKNLFLYTKMRNVAGISQTDAQKSSDMFMKCQYLDEITGGRGVTFATGTPVSNSMVELYTIMRYLQYDTIQKMGLGHFDSWAATFGETVTAIELAPEGTGYRAKTRFARFFNLPELISLFKESADVQTADMLNLPVPEAEYINEVLKPSEEQKELVGSFAERAEEVRKGNVDSTIDNMLKITNDGRKCALDQRLINDMLPDAPESKVNLCVKNVFDVWQETEGKRSTQLVFCDLSTPKNDGTFNVYDDIREKLVARGIPREEIVFIHEANTEARKAELFAKVRAGQVRVLLGSTPKLGAGTNIQDRLVALHHLDCPWKPSDLEQQEGRILRQGNQNEKVKIFRYVTENTFDAYMWQILENKQKFISQIMTSKSPVRACEDVDDTALSYAEIKALATGNPYIKEKMDLDIQVSKLKLMKANHTSQKYRLETDIARKYPQQIAAVKERIAGLKSDAGAAKSVLGRDKDAFEMTIGGTVYTDRKEAGTALIAACAGLKAVGTAGQIGQLQEFSLYAEFDTWKQSYMLSIKRECSYKIEVGKDALGNLQRISNALSGIEKQLLESEQKLATLQQRLATAQEEVEKPFPKEQELAEKLSRLAELNALLNMDEKGSPEAVGIDEGTQEAAVCEEIQDVQEEQIADSPYRPSILNKLNLAKERCANSLQENGKGRKEELDL